ncbi:MAG: aminotransferase class I/II-fold pyridoxal phosphate-dependent enzyme [Phycisphaerae bacterium]
MKPLPRFEDPVPAPGFETLCSHFAEAPAQRAGAASPPIYQSSTFIYPDFEAFSRRLKAHEHYDYTRGGNPTTTILEAKLARLEKGGWAEFFGSGMGAISAVVNACVKQGAHVVCVGHAYGPTQAYLTHIARFGVETTFVSGLVATDFIAALRENTSLVYLESPTSWWFECIEIGPIAEECRRRGIVTAFDNSWASPYFQTPLELGVDLSLHSATKYLGGHSDVVAGAVIGRDQELRKRLWREVELCGATLDPFAAWLLLRGLRTLPQRMEYHQRSGLAIAKMLSSHPRVARVRHPGLEPNAVARTQLRGASGLFSFELHDASREAVGNLLDRLKLFRQGVSWGGFESLALGAKLAERPDAPPTWLIRLSCGLESADDLIADLKQALEA